MRRKQVKQFINTKWFPSFLKSNIREFLDWFVLKVNATKPFIPIIEEGLSYTKNKNIVNIDFNLGAGIKTVTPFLDAELSTENLKIKKFNTEKNGLYTCINSFHQLNQEEAKQVLTQIAISQNPVVILEGNNDSLWQIVGMTFFVPLSVLIMSPFVKPFRWSRILFTYLIPILPFVIMIDGCIALLKLYNPKDLEELTSDIIIGNYKWEFGKKDNGRGGKIMYLIGHKTL
ncbi:hypothetical protein [Ichthyenterobacterium magnum]|uniref:Uncharacterized protein n=1 Tax=Ichthyenterobacterium magnum TaxID=1230530 RepID=A0A420DGS1_9FLAO|nr:hypothetical protein [Ichthyenterobacterium magnum]RKE92277.1 hypothetical protein BXY80_2195 [Ichthyenterobacterium magnum]